MAFDLVPSLVTLSARRIVISLWYADYVVFKDGEVAFKYNITKIAEDKVASNIETLVPSFLHLKVLPLIRHVGEQIRRWIVYNKKFISADMDVCKEIYWSPFGLVDFAKTAGNVICRYDSTMLPVKSFDLACATGVGSQICKLWPKVREQFSPTNMTLSVRPETIHWALLLKEKFPTSPSVHMHSIDVQFFVQRFLDAIDHCNLELIRFYFQSMNPSRQLKYISEFHFLYNKLVFPYECKAPVLLFFLQYMSPSQREEFFLANPRETLYCFLEWPLQSNFLSIAEKVMPAVPAEDFYLIFKSTVQRMMQFEYESEQYITLFRSLWMKSSQETKQHCFHKRIYRIMRNLFHPFPVEEALAALLKSGDAEEKVHQAFFCDMKAMFAFLSEDNKHRAFRAVLEKYIPEEERKCFEIEYSKFTEEYLKDYYAE